MVEAAADDSPGILRGDQFSQGDDLVTVGGSVVEREGTPRPTEALQQVSAPPAQVGPKKLLIGPPTAAPRLRRPARLLRPARRQD